MTFDRLETLLEAWILVYFLVLNGAYLLQNLFALFAVRAWSQRWSGESRPWIHTGFEPSITLVVPAYNESVAIAASVRSLLQIEYPRFEIVVVNDGSSDDTMGVLRREFDLVAVPEVYRDRIKTRPVRAIYRSRRHRKLRVVDKDNGRKADAVNAGVNLARSPLVLVMDGDSFLQRDSLLRVVQPFLEDPLTVACGGTVRIANGCKASQGFLTEVRTPDSWVARFQVIEYLRAFLFGRMGWAPFNALCIISGAFGLFDRETVVRAGGLRHGLGEDMELTVRLHHRLRLDERRPYRITFLPDPVCWTEVPESLRVLGRQRIRWQRGLTETLWWHRRLLFHPRGGFVGWAALPFLLFFEWMSALLEVFGYVIIFCLFAAGILSWTGFLSFLAVAMGTGIVLSLSALLMEEVSFHMYPRFADLGKLIAAAVLENFGYRQVNALWRFTGILYSLTGKKATWGVMPRSGTWSGTG